MADEQTPQSELIDDAIRQAERQLEEKLHALRMSALGETTSATTSAHDDVAILHPTGGESEAAQTPESAPEPVPAQWHETESEDLTFVPVGDVPSASVSDLFVPESTTMEPAEALDEHPTQEDRDDTDEPSTIAETADALRESLSATVTDLTPVWEDDEPSATMHEAPLPTTRRASSTPPAVDTPSARWSDASRTSRDESPQRVTALPSEDELQFWAHTRTALRNLQQVVDDAPTHVVGGVSTEVARLLHEELGGTEQALRSLQASTEQALPQLAEQVQASIEHAVETPTNAVRQLREELPLQVDRVTREVQESLYEALDRTTSTTHGAIQQDLAQLEQTISSSVARSAQGTTDAVARVGDDVDVLGETVVRFERGVHANFDRFESQIRAAVERVEQNLRDELVAPTETVRKLDDEMPARFDRIERSLADQLQHGQRDVSQVLTSLVDADRAALDRLASITSTLDEERARRTEDLDVVVDTVTTGWQALAGAVKALYEQADENSRRLAAIEQRLSQIRDVEGALERTLTEFQRHMRDLKPSPVVVTVSHDEAEVRNETRAGWSERPDRG